MKDTCELRDLLTSAVRHIDDARGAFEVGARAWHRRGATLSNFDDARDGILEALAALPPPVLPDDASGEAEERLEILREAMAIDHVAGAYTAAAARAYADAADRAIADWKERKKTARLEAASAA